MATATANSQPDTVRIANLLKAGSDYVLRPGNEKGDLDSAQFFFNQALILERILHHLTKNGWSALIPKKKWLERLHSEMKGVNI